MYELYSNEWWDMVMNQAIIIAIITTIGTIIVALITGAIAYNFTQKAILTKLEESSSKQRDLSLEHCSLSKEHNELSKEHGTLSEQQSVLLERSNSILKTSYDTYSSVAEVAKDFIEEKTKEQMRYENLSEKQRDMLSAVDNIKALGEEVKRLSFELAEIKGDKQQILEENITLKAKIQELEKKKPLTGSDFDRGLSR